MEKLKETELIIVSQDAGFINTIREKSDTKLEIYDDYDEFFNSLTKKSEFYEKVNDYVYSNFEYISGIINKNMRDFSSLLSGIDYSELKYDEIEILDFEILGDSRTDIVFVDDSNAEVKITLPISIIFEGRETTVDTQILEEHETELKFYIKIEDINGSLKIVHNSLHLELNHNSRISEPRAPLPFELNKILNKAHRKIAQRYHQGENTCEKCGKKVMVSVSDDEYPNRDDEWLYCPWCKHPAYIRTGGIPYAYKTDY